MQTNPAVEQNKTLNGPWVREISPVGKEKFYGSSEWKTERVRKEYIILTFRYYWTTNNGQRFNNNSIYAEFLLTRRYLTNWLTAVTLQSSTTIWGGSSRVFLCSWIWSLNYFTATYKIWGGVLFCLDILMCALLWTAVSLQVSSLY